MDRWCTRCGGPMGAEASRDAWPEHRVLCARCEQARPLNTPEDAGSVLFLHGDVRLAGYSGDVGMAASILDRAQALGLRTEDLLLAFVQPALYEVGERWHRGLLTTDEERRFTAVAAAILEGALARHPEFSATRQSPRPMVFLANAEGNHHFIGIRLVEFALLSRGISCYSAPRGSSNHELASLARSLGARFVGLSISMPSQLDQVRDLIAALGAQPNPPRVMLGGNIFRHGVTAYTDLDADICATPEEAAAHITNALSA